MTWLAVKIVFDKALLWCKKYWQILLGISIPIIVMLITAGRRGDLKKALENTKEAHRKDVEALEKSHQAQLEAKQQEIQAKEEAAIRYANDLARVEAEYNVSRNELSRRKKKELDKILSGDMSAHEVSEELANLFGGNVKS